MFLNLHLLHVVYSAITHLLWEQHMHIHQELIKVKGHDGRCSLMLPLIILYIVYLWGQVVITDLP